jgi:hypothetical protein
LAIKLRFYIVVSRRVGNPEPVFRGISVMISNFISLVMGTTRTTSPTSSSTHPPPVMRSWRVGDRCQALLINIKKKYYVPGAVGRRLVRWGDRPL